MARFAQACTRPDGTTRCSETPTMRVLPFGGQPLGDHHLVGLVGAHWSVPSLTAGFNGSRAEMF